MSWFSNLFKDGIDRRILKQAYNWGKGRARTKLVTFYAYQEKYPNMPVKELYYLTIQNSVLFTEDIARQIVDGAADIAEGNIGSGIKLSSLKQPFGLRSVVKNLLIYEEYHHFGFSGHPHPNGMYEAYAAVDDIIPENI
ncbi:MAG: hypothetical protein OXD54_13485 [Candidatus Poribacteria bacterium]|nr:hypothetical protein [Candidatus Poribacteria bacterium]